MPLIYISALSLFRTIWFLVHTYTETQARQHQARRERERPLLLFHGLIPNLPLTLSTCVRFLSISVSRGRRVASPMADVFRLAANHSLRFSSSVLSSFDSLRLGLAPPLNSDWKLRPLSASSAAPLASTRRDQSLSFKVKARITETDQPKWWEKNTANMTDIHSTQEFLNALSDAGDKLVIVEFYGTWCASCRALFPKLCKTAEENPEIIFLKVNFDENKPMCKSLNVKVLPFFHFYRGADGQLESFSCSLVKFQKIKDAIKTHNTARCSIGPPKGVGDLLQEASP